VFDLFTQVSHTLDRSQGGLGIGLTLVRQLVEMHGGMVTATSDGPGCGSEFTVTLPTIRHCVVTEELEPDRDDRICQSTRILVVDDNTDSADTLANLLRLAGHEVEVAYDGPTGLTAAQSFEPSVVVLDIGLPGMDGLVLAERIRQQQALKDALLIAVTGYGQLDDQTKSRKAGFDFHLTKPVELAALQSLLDYRDAVPRERRHKALESTVD
jgi:CheY-like chemotaxis protein